MDRKVKLVDPATGAVKTFEIGAGLYAALLDFRYWFASLYAIRMRAWAGVGAALIVAMVYFFATGMEGSGALAAFAYVSLGVFFASNMSTIAIKHYLTAGWKFAEPNSAAARWAKMLLGIDQGSASLKAVLTARTILWLAVAIGLIKTAMRAGQVYSMAYDAEAGDASAALVASFIVGAVHMVPPLVTAFLINKVVAGRNWARVFLLVGTILAVAVVLRGYILVGFTVGESGSPVYDGLRMLLLVAQVGFYASALFLLFTKPGSAWFQSGGAAALATGGLENERLAP